MKQQGESFGVKVTIERGKYGAAINFQGHKFDVSKADSKIKEMLFKIKSDSMEQGKIMKLFALYVACTTYP